MGRKTSVYLSDELDERVKASGVTPAELIRRGLDAGEPEPLEAMLARVVRSVLDERDTLSQRSAQAGRAHAINCKCGVCRPGKGS
jgi:hypothetical protein